MSGLQFTRQSFERGNLIHRLRLQRLGMEGRLADIVQRRVDRVCERVDSGRLLLARYDYACPGMRLKVLRDSVHPC